jgi:hypothetical protein
MVKRTAIALALLFAAVLALFVYRLYDRFPWLEASARAHSEKGSTDCGHLSNASDEPHLDPDAVIACVVSAHQQRRPFFVTFRFQGSDEQFNDAFVGDSKGDVIEIFYATGTVERANTLLRRRCDGSRQFIVQRETAYHIPQLHCEPWPPSTLERDYIFW